MNTPDAARPQRVTVHAARALTGASIEALRSWPDYDPVTDTLPCPDPPAAPRRSFDDWYDETWWTPLWPLFLFVILVGFGALVEWLIVGHVS